MGVYSAIDCAEEHASVNETYELETGLSATVTLRCAWADRFLLMEDIMGRVWPHASGAWANKASSVPDKSNYVEVGQSADYVHALVTVNYGTKVKDLFSESLEPTAEFVTGDHKGFRWSAVNGDPLLEGEAPGYLRKGLNLVRTLYQLAAIPASTLTCVGKSNSAAYVSGMLGLTFAAQTLLFQPPTMNRTFKTTGTEGWTLQTKFAYKPETWNKFFRSKTNSWETIVNVDGTTYIPYPPASFADFLF